MNVNPKTVRRVMVLIAGAALIVGALAGVYIVRQRQIAAKYLGYREAGIAAFAAEDFAAALQHLKPYIGKHRDDRDALFAYAAARSRVEEADARHLPDGIKAFQQLRELEPHSPRVRYALLDLYTKNYRHADAIELADEVLAASPDDVRALRAKALALENLRRLDAAVAVAEHLNEVSPTSLEDHQITYQLYARTNKPAAEVIARAEAMRAKYPDDPRFELLAAIAYGQSGQGEKALGLLRAAAERTPGDPAFVRQLAMMLDRNHMFAESAALLDRAVAKHNGDPRLRAILAQRLWQNGYAKGAADCLTDVDPASAESDSTLLALRALALYHLDQADEARRIVDAIARRTNDGKAQAWATALAARFANPQPAPRAQIVQYRAALTRDPDNGIIRYMVGEAYERLGESEPALSAWRMAADLEPSWSKPPEKIARALAATGRTEQAVQQATIAQRRAPHQPSATITYVVVAFKHLGQSNDPARVDELLKHIESVQKAVPNEPETLPIQVALLARKGQRDAAIGVAKGALGAEKPPGVMTLLSLAAISRTERLGLEGQINALIEKSGEPMTPALALARAGELAASGSAAAGLKFLEDHAAKHAGAGGAAWQLAIAQYREQTRDPKAAEAWLTLGEAHPGDIAVQTGILRSAASAKGNRPFIERTIDRVRTLTGGEGTLWKIERARWLLGSDRERDHSDAVNTLADLVRSSPTLAEPRLLLAAALEKVDNVSGAVKELRVAAEQQPNSAAIATELARLLQAQGKFEDARLYLERVAKQDALDPSIRRHVAAMFAQQGAVERAAQLLQEAAKQRALDPAGLLLLAELQRRQGLTTEADALYQELLSREPVSAEAIESSADFYASQGKLDEARKIVARLDGAVAARPGVRELVRARFAERHETPDAATAAYAAATTAAPTEATTWRERVGYLMRTARANEAAAVADEALKALPGNASLQSLKAYAAASANIASGQPDLQPLIDDLSKDPANARSLATAQLLQEEAAGRLNKTDAAARFRQLAERFPRHKPLQLEAVRRSIAAGDDARAAEFALRTMQSFPGDADVARLATNVFRQARQWKQMEAAARDWRSRSLDRPAEADVAIAEAQLAQHNAAGAAAQLAPHAARASASPESNSPLLITYARALAAAGREQEARALLEPLLPASPRWRSAWMSIAGGDVNDAAVATRWLEHVAPRVMTDSPAERVALARAWVGVGERFAQLAAYEAARKVLAPIAEQPDASPDVLNLFAAVLQAGGDGAGAETNYRKVLATRPDEPTALNNLAYLLLTGAGANGDPAKLQEAVSLAGKAVALGPGVASYHDTLARVRFRAGDRDGALKAFDRALELEPDLVDAMIGKATAHTAMGNAAGAREMLQRIDQTLPRRPNLSAELKRELDLARDHANAAVDTR